MSQESNWVDENRMISVRLSAGECCRLCDALAKVSAYMTGSEHGNVEEDVAEDLALNTMSLVDLQIKVEYRIREIFFD